MDTSKLKPGDVLLYKGVGLYGWIIRVKCWHSVGHCEVYIGDGKTVASRDGLGVAIYPIRTKDLEYILRPTLPFNLSKAMAWFYAKANGLKYGWVDLLNFVGININTDGIVCSPFVTLFLRAGDIPVFDSEPAQKVAPFEFLLSELLIPVEGVV